MNFNIDIENINYINIFCKDSNGKDFTIKALVKRVDDKELISCAKYSETLEMINTQEVTLKFICKDGVYKTETFLKSIENDNPYIVFVLKTPENIIYEQNREFFRISVKYDCLCYTEDGNNCSGKIMNFSANGVCIEFPKAFIISKNVKLQLFIENKNIEVLAKYIRSNFTADSYLVSFNFTKISEKNRDYISKICIKKQLEEKRNSLN